MGRYAPFIVANPATIGSTRGKSTAPQIAASAIPWLMNSAPRISELHPVAQAVMIEAIGPVAPVRMETLPLAMLMQELGFMKGWGSFPVAVRIRSAAMSASSPPIAVPNVTATRGATSGVISRPARFRARWTTSRAWGKIGEVQWAISRGFRKG